MFFENNMNLTELKNIIRNEVMRVISEKSVPQPYDRKSARKMTPSITKKRENIGNKLLKNKNAVKYFKDNFEKEWEDYLWATATNLAFKAGE